MSLLSLFGLSGMTQSAHAPSAEAQSLRDQVLASLLVMAWVVEARDPYTGGHLWRVSRYASLLAERAGLPRHECARISIGGFLHDLGKVGVPDAILRKPDRLSGWEYEQMQTHPELGERMLAGHPLAALVRDEVLLHHERPDGRGYPKGMSAEQIPMGPRVVGICDAFDAMTSSRPYRAGLPIAEALARLEAGLGQQFDAALGRIMLNLGREGLLDHIVGHSDDGIPLRACMTCGPTLVVRREQRPGEHIACPSCGGDYQLEQLRPGNELRAVPTGQRASAADLRPQPDQALIQRLIGDTARDLPGHWGG